MRHSNKGLLVWTYICADAFLMFILYYLGIYLFLLKDTSFISFAIVGLYLVTNLLMVETLINKTEEFTSRLISWIPSALMGLGLLGTVVGFFHVFNDLFTNIDFSNIQNIKDIIGQLTTGFSIALISTISGLSTSLILTLKLVWFKLSNER